MLPDTADMTASTFYYQLAARSQPDARYEIKLRIAEIAKESYYTYGYRRIWWGAAP